jgi:hypothetical protein
MLFLVDIFTNPVWKPDNHHVKNLSREKGVVGRVTLSPDDIRWTFLNRIASI